MSTRCLRPGCDRPAVARLTYDPVACELWLDPADPPGGRTPAQELCEFHAERLTVPRGWTVTDRRAPLPQTAAAPEGEAPAPEGEAAAPEGEAAQPGDATAPGSTAAAPAGPLRRRREPALLQRAFAASGPQRSVLTTPSGDGPADAAGPPPEQR